MKVKTINKEKMLMYVRSRVFIKTAIIIIMLVVSSSSVIANDIAKIAAPCACEDIREMIKSHCTGGGDQQAVSAADDSAPLEIHFFGSGTCGECMEIKAKRLEPMRKEFAGKLKINVHDTDQPEGLALVIRMEKEYGLTKNSPQTLFFPDTVLLGYDDIMKNVRDMTIARLDKAPSGKAAAVNAEGDDDLNKVLKERFDTFTFIGIISAAAVDAVNPCAIATMIFLVSFLATQKRKRLEVLITGLSFTVAVFITYMLLGLGAFKLITMADQFRWASLSIKWVAVGFAGIIGVISLGDALRFKKSGDAKDITLQLPKSVKMRIHKVITTKMTGTSLYVGAFVAGFLVTLLEAVCTGQVYLPTIVLMTRHGTGDLQLLGWFYLTLYNIIFVLPLIIVMIAAYRGMKWNTLSKMMQNNLTMLKIMLGMVMIGLAMYLARVETMTLFIVLAATGLVVYLAELRSMVTEIRDGMAKQERAMKSLTGKTGEPAAGTKDAPATSSTSNDEAN